MPKIKRKIGKYSIFNKLKESNYALIYKVKEPDNNTTILKLARTKNLEDDELISREFQILSQFKYPTIVPVFENVQCPDLTPLSICQIKMVWCNLRKLGNQPDIFC